MDFALVDLSSDENYLEAEAWDWRPALEAIRSFRLIDGERSSMMAFNGTDVKLTRDEAREIGRRLREEVLGRMKPGDRLLLDLEVTSELAGEFDENEPTRNYGASYEWLESFAAFCVECEGFEVV